MNQFYGQLIMLVALFAVMYFLLIRPQQKKDKEIKAMREALKVGDEILTIGGIYGRIVRIREDRLVIQVGADKTKLEIAKWSVNNVEKKSTDRYADKAEESDKKVSAKNIKKLGEKKEDAAPAVEAPEAALEVQEAESK